MTEQEVLNLLQEAKNKLLSMELDRAELAALKAENARLYAANVALQAGAVEAAIEWLDTSAADDDGTMMPKRNADESWTAWLLRVHREATAP